MYDQEKIDNSLSFLKNRFKEYYEKNKIVLPYRFGKREFAFIFFKGKGMYRHLSFTRKKNIDRFVIDKSPAHAYYSTAYYQKPDAPTMQEKKWMGAELIFDLDSDHLPNAEKLSYEQQLKLVKIEFIKLVEDFLMKDFGFEEQFIDLYFSGGRGYHCHVNDPKILNLDSNERREIVDYITGRDIIDSYVFHDETTTKTTIGNRTFASGKTLKMPSPDEPGWKGRISKGIIDIVEEIINNDNPKQKLKQYGVSDKTADKLLKDFSDDRIKRIKQGKLDQTSTIRRFFLNNALRKTAVSMVSGETDEPVTCDVKRLIRLPGSLHGKTGFKVVNTPIDTLKNFEPLNDAVVLPNDMVKIDLKEKTNIKIKNEEYALEEGIHEIPTYLAVYLIGGRKALIEL